MSNFLKYVFIIVFSFLTFSLGVHIVEGLFHSLPEYGLGKLYMVYLVVCVLFISTKDFAEKEDTATLVSRGLYAATNRFTSMGILYILYLIFS